VILRPFIPSSATQQARIIGRDVQELFSLHERADELRALPLKDANNGAFVFIGTCFTKTLRPHFAAHEDAVAVHGGGGGIFFDDDLEETGLIGLDKTFSAACDLNDARNQIGLACLDVAVSFGAEDEALALEIGQSMLELLLLIGLECEELDELGHVGRTVLLTRQQLEDSGFHGRTMAWNGWFCRFSLGNRLGFEIGIRIHGFVFGADLIDPTKGRQGSEVVGVMMRLTMKSTLTRLLFCLLMTLALPCFSEEDSRAFELRIYTAAPGKLPDLLARFRHHTCKLFEKHGMENIGYWVPVDAENGSETTLYYILGHKSREAAKESFAAFGKDPEWQEARRASEANGRLLAKAPESIFLKTTDYSVPVKTGVADKERAFELRIYDTVEGKLDALHSRFRDHTMGLFTKHGMTHIGYWTPTDADKGSATKLIYVLAHASKEAGLASFTAFRADPTWIEAKAASEKAAGGSLTVPDGVKSIYMKPTDFSPLR
jgi:hypothetical protein